MKKIKMNSKIKNSLIAASIIAAPSAIALGIYFGTKKPKAVWTPTKDFLALRTSDVDIVNNVINVRGGNDLSRLISVNSLTTGYKGAKNLIKKNDDGSSKVIAKYDIELSKLNNEANLSKEYIKINKNIDAFIKKSKNLNYGIYAIKDVNKNKFIVELVEVNSLSNSQLKIAKEFVENLGEMALPNDPNEYGLRFPMMFMAEHFGTMDIADDYNFDMGVKNYLNDEKLRKGAWTNKRNEFINKIGEKIISLNTFDNEHLDPKRYSDLLSSNVVLNKYSRPNKVDDEGPFDLWAKIIPKNLSAIDREMIKIKIINSEDFPSLDNYNEADKVIGLNSKMTRSKSIFNKKIEKENTYYTLAADKYFKSDRSDPLTTILKGIKKGSFKNKKLIIEVQVVDKSKIPEGDDFNDPASLKKINAEANYLKEKERIEILLDKIPNNWDEAKSIDLDKIFKSEKFKIDLKWFKHNFWDKNDKTNFEDEIFTDKLLKEKLAVRFVPSIDMINGKFNINIQFYNIDNSDKKTTSIETGGTGKLLNPTGAFNIKTKSLNLDEIGTLKGPDDIEKSKKTLKKFLTQDITRYFGEPLIGPGLDLLGKTIPTINSLIKPFIHTMELMSKDFGLSSPEGIKTSGENGYKLSFEKDSSGKMIQNWHDFRYQDIFDGKEGNDFLEKIIKQMIDSPIIDINASLKMMENFEQESFNKDPLKNQWTSIDWLIDLKAEGHYKLYSLLSVFNNISDTINNKILEKHPQAKFDIGQDKQVDEFILFLKQNKLVGNSFSINDIINNPMGEIANILLRISDKNLQLPPKMIDGIINIVPIPLISKNKEGFANLIKYLFEKRSYRRSEFTNLRILFEILGESQDVKVNNIKFLLEDTGNIITNLFSLFANANLDFDQIDILANIIAKLPLYGDSIKETIEKLLPFIKSIIPSTIDLFGQIYKEGFKSIFEEIIPKRIDINRLGHVTADEKRILIKYFGEIYKNYPKYLEYFIGEKSINEYVNSITLMSDVKSKLFTKFELFLSTLVYEFVDKGADKFDPTVNTIITLLNSHLPSLIKTLNQIFVEGPFNNGKYSIYKFLEKIKYLPSLAAGFLPENIKPIINLIFGEGKSNLLLDSIYKGIGTAVNGSPQGDVNNFFKNIFKLLAPSGYIKGKQGEKGSISNDDIQKILQGFLQGFNSKEELSNSIKKLISKELLNKNVQTNIKFSVFLTNMLGEMYDNEKYKLTSGAEIIMPKMRKMLNSGLISLDKEESGKALLELKTLANSLINISSFNNDVKETLEKIGSISEGDIKNIADMIHSLLNTGVNSISSKGIDSFMNLLRKFNIFNGEEVPNIGESILKFLNHGILGTSKNDIRNIIKTIGALVPISDIVNSILDFIIDGWNKNYSFSTNQATQIYNL